MTYETRRVVISNCFGIAVRLQDRVGLNNSVLQIGLLFTFCTLARLFIATKNGKVCDDLLGIFSFSSARFASDEHRLIPENIKMTPCSLSSS